MKGGNPRVCKTVWATVDILDMKSLLLFLSLAVWANELPKKKADEERLKNMAIKGPPAQVPKSSDDKKVKLNTTCAKNGVTYNSDQPGFSECLKDSGPTDPRYNAPPANTFPGQNRGVGVEIK